ncbi:hypothetical protein GGI02_002466 [Coemansia sp. RSA 2322]|nr:hypothetical protein GGI02_002466 [Coemansia sp. RSA 2322]
MDPKDSRLPPTSMPSSLDYTSDGQYDASADRPVVPRQLSKQPQHSPASRSNGLLGKMFRKGPPKHPKLNPIGISSKDFFSSEYQAPVASLPAPPPPPPPPLSSEPGLLAKGNRLTRKASALLSPLLPASAPSHATSPQSLTPKSTPVSAFSDPAAASSSGCLSDSETMNDSAARTLHFASGSQSSFIGARRATQHQQIQQQQIHQQLERSLPRIGCMPDIDSRDDSCGVAGQPQRRRPSRLKLDVLPGAARTATPFGDRATPQSPRSPCSPCSPESAALMHFSANLPQHSPRTDSTGRRKDPETASPSALLAMYADAERGLSAGENKKRGALWRAKLSFTNLRRPDSRRQRHQSFDSNSVDIAAHPKMYAESPLMSVPSVAPATGRSRSPGAAGYDHHVLAGLLGMATSPARASPFASPHSAFGSDHGCTVDSGCSELASVGDLGGIDKDFLLTIQRNSALEARRQRRRETRRNTLSFLGATGIPTALHEATPLAPAASAIPAHRYKLAGADFKAAPANCLPEGAPPPSVNSGPHFVESCAKEWRSSAPRQDRHAACVEIGHRDTLSISVAGETTDQQQQRPSAVECAVQGAGQVDGREDGIKQHATPAIVSSAELRPTSLDSLTYSEQAVTGSSSRPGSRGCGEGKRSQESGAWCSANGPLIGYSTARRATAMNSLPPPAAAAFEPHPSAMAASSFPDAAPWLSSRTGLVSGVHYPPESTDDDACVPPVPPLPAHIALQGHQNGNGISCAHADTTMRPVTASARGSPRFVADSRRYRGSASVLPSAVQASKASPFGSPERTQQSSILAGTDEAALRLRQYHMASTTASQLSAASDGTLTVDLNSDAYEERQLGPTAHPSLYASASFNRKLSQPDTRLGSLSRPSTSSIPSPSILSKSTSHINTRGSVDGSKSVGKTSSSNSPGYRNGIGRLFSATPPSRKPCLGTNHLAQSPPSPDMCGLNATQPHLPPTSPTVSSLVGDPMARRRIRDQLASSRAFDRLLEEDDEFTMAISLTPSVAGMSPAAAPSKWR